MVNCFVLSTWKFTDFSEVNLVELFRAETKRFSTYTIQLEMPGFIRQKLNCCMNSALYCLLVTWLTEDGKVHCCVGRLQSERRGLHEQEWWVVKCLIQAQQRSFVSDPRPRLAHAPYTRECCCSIWYNTTI